MLACFGATVRADEAETPPANPRTIVVTGQRAAADLEVKQRVETALHSDPYF